MSQHTPGPWIVMPRNRNNRQGESMFDVVAGKAENTEMICDKARKADARLIAKAPEMYENLKEDLCYHLNSIIEATASVNEEAIQLVHELAFQIRRRNRALLREIEGERE